MSRAPHPSKHTWKVEVGQRKIIGKGLRRHPWNDIFHSCMAVSWARLFSWYAVIFLLVQLVFSALYALQPDSVTGATPITYLNLLFFSVEVFGTVSFGGLQPHSTYGHIVAAIEIMLGIISYAVLTGLTFARFSRPKAQLLFAVHPLIGLQNGQPTFTTRVANTRHNYISDAQAKVWLVATERGTDGLQKSRARRFYRLPLVRDENPMFVLSWSLFHIIDEHSPLHGLTAKEFDIMDANIVIIVSGFDENFGQEVRARHVYVRTDFRWDHVYADIITEPDRDTLHVDYGKFHDVFPVLDANAAVKRA